jgi:hypothetical protein
MLIVNEYFFRAYSAEVVFINTVEIFDTQIYFQELGIKAEAGPDDLHFYDAQ